jgi:hypothetical protein
LKATIRGAKKFTTILFRAGEKKTVDLLGL